VAVVLSGSGFKDGSEITEAVSTLIALSESGAKTQCFAPVLEIPATAHTDLNVGLGSRNVFEESGRIARGQVRDLRELRASDFEAVVFPGGYGAALHLCDWARRGSQATVLPDVQRVIREFHQAAKPIGAICIAPVIVAKVLGAEGVTVTIGKDLETAREVEKTGARHIDCEVTEYISDREHRVLTTPAYMFEAQPHEVFAGVRKMVRELVEMA
jgi:enhancing lycopene biosynthesis protein 2